MRTLWESDSGIVNCNGLFWLRHKEREARRLWEMGKNLGLCYEGDEEQIINKLIAMEERDEIGDGSGTNQLGREINQVTS